MNCFYFWNKNLSLTCRRRVRRIEKRWGGMRTEPRSAQCPGNSSSGPGWSCSTSVNHSAIIQQYVFILVGNVHWRLGALGTRAPHLGLIFVIFMQFSRKIGQNNGLAPPPLRYKHTECQKVAAVARSHWNALWRSKIGARPIPKCYGKHHLRPVMHHHRPVIYHV